MTTQFLASEVDVCNTPALQIVRTETFAKELTGTFATNFIEHIHLFADCFSRSVIKPAGIPYIGDQGIGEWSYAGTGTVLINGFIQILIGNGSAVQFASCFRINQVHFGQTDERIIGRFGILWSVGTFDQELTATVCGGCGICTKSRLEYSARTAICRI